LGDRSANLAGRSADILSLSDLQRDHPDGSRTWVCVCDGRSGLLHPAAGYSCAATFSAQCSAAKLRTGLHMLHVAVLACYCRVAVSESGVDSR
jgi:hypothetical protein